MERLIGILARISTTRTFSSTVVALTLMAVLIAGAGFPRHDWDLIGYVASLYKADGLEGRALKDAVYGEVLDKVGDEDFSRLTGGDEFGGYRAAVYQDPQALEEQIPFYSIRPLYLAAMKFMGVLGEPYASAAYMASALFGALSVLVASGILARQRIPQVFLPVMLIFAGVFGVARQASPDSLACLLSLGLMFCFLQRSAFSLLLAALLPLARTDFILLSLLFAVVASWFFPRKWVALSAGVALALYVAVNQASGNYGYLTIFNFTLLGFDPYPASMRISTDIGEYARAYATGLAQAVLHPHFLVYFLAALSLLNGYRAGRRLDELDCTLILALAFVICHLALFPLYLERFFLFPALVSLIYVIERPRLLVSSSAKRRLHTA
ncbi:hypothetical protein [Azotobacter salinestris]|uniref:hypothetical protein n=1 Tax=Azotobacter salinestris TaxID=69964 RepID=UPI0032DE3B53